MKSSVRWGLGPYMGRGSRRRDLGVLVDTWLGTDPLEGMVSLGTG